MLRPRFLICFGISTALTSTSAQTYRYELTASSVSVATLNARGAQQFRYLTVAQDPTEFFSFFSVWERGPRNKSIFAHLGAPLDFRSASAFSDVVAQRNAAADAGYVFVASSSAGFYYQNHIEGPLWRQEVFPRFSADTAEVMRRDAAARGLDGYILTSVIDVSHESQGNPRPTDLRVIYRYEVPRSRYEVVIDTFDAADLPARFAVRGAEGWRFGGPLFNVNLFNFRGYVFWRRIGESTPLTYRLHPTHKQTTPLFRSLAAQEGEQGLRFIDYVPTPDYNDYWALFANDPNLGAVAGPSISLQPRDQTTTAVGSAAFNVTATSSSAISYQWRKNGTFIPGATRGALMVENVPADGAGVFDVVLTDARGRTVSDDAHLTVARPPATGSRLMNVSVLTSLDPAESFTLGYVLAGPAGNVPQAILARAAGPALAPLGVATPLSDPYLESFTGAIKRHENDNWEGSAELAAAARQVGAFPFLDPASKDSAALLSLPPGQHSTRISARGAASGTVLAEIYDAIPDDPRTSGSRLVNLSVLKHIGTQLTVGVVVGGTEPLPVLVRAVGPTLASPPFALGGTMSDPKITVYAGGALLAENDNWSTGTSSAVFARVAAFPLLPNSGDAALLTTLPPGNYSILVEGVNGPGTALVEVYDAR